MIISRYARDTPRDSVFFQGVGRNERQFHKGLLRKMCSFSVKFQQISHSQLDETLTK
jgi:hypothetical protein